MLAACDLTWKTGKWYETLLWFHEWGIIVPLTFPPFHLYTAIEESPWRGWLLYCCWWKVDLDSTAAAAAAAAVCSKFQQKFFGPAFLTGGEFSHTGRSCFVVWFHFEFLLGDFRVGITAFSWTNHGTVGRLIDWLIDEAIWLTHTRVRRRKGFV